MIIFYTKHVEKVYHLGKDFHCMPLFHRPAQDTILLRIAVGGWYKFLIDSVLLHHKLLDSRSSHSNRPNYRQLNNTTIK